MVDLMMEMEQEQSEFYEEEYDRYEDDVREEYLYEDYENRGLK